MMPLAFSNSVSLKARSLEVEAGELPLVLGGHSLAHAPEQLLHLGRPFADQDFAAGASW